MRFLDKSYLEDIISLQDKIGHSLPDPTIFRLHSIDFFRDLFELERSIIGIVTDEGLVAYSLIYLPGKRKKIWA
ncbi:MAG: hypothetical protein LUQ38_04175 [Methanotrichaceae archaeon]|nr:hypothetical protein [Methanotrichaceae archaeon]